MTPQPHMEFERRREIYKSSVLPMCHADDRSTVPSRSLLWLIELASGLIAIAIMAALLWFITRWVWGH